MHHWFELKLDTQYTILSSRPSSSNFHANSMQLTYDHKVLNFITWLASSNLHSKSLVLTTSCYLIHMREAKHIRLCLLRKHSMILFWFKYMLMILYLDLLTRICEQFVTTMHGEFEMSIMGELNYFLGL